MFWTAVSLGEDAEKEEEKACKWGEKGPLFHPLRSLGNKEATDAVQHFENHPWQFYFLEFFHFL